MSNKIKIEPGERRSFSTGATKQASSGKGRPSLIPGDAILEVSKHFEGGVGVYGERNWEKGIPLSVWLDSLERHLQQLKMGMTDEPHARALVWNALVYLATKLRIENELLPAELDDMPDYKLKAEVKALPPIKGETIEEVIAINDELAEDLKEKIPMGHVDYEWYCAYPSCYEKGKANSDNNCYYCPKHKEED